MAKRIIYKNGAEVKIKNRRIFFEENKDKKSFLIGFRTADIPTEKLDIPTCSHKVIRGKVVETVINLSEEGLQELIGLYIQYKHSKSNEID